MKNTNKMLVGLGQFLTATRSLSAEKGFGLALGLGVLSGGMVHAEQKNVLFIPVDDLKPLMGCYGHPEVKTPNLDRLAAHSVVFRNNHCQQAVSGPTRASLMTGKRPDYTQVWDLQTLIRDKNPDIVTLPQYLKSQGYVTAGTGKTFDRRSVDSKHDSLSWSIPYIDLKKHDDNGGAYIFEKRKVPTECADVPDSVTNDWRTMMVGKRLIDELSGGNKPFFISVGFEKPHLPFVAPKRYWDLYNRDSIQLPKYRVKPQGAPDYALQPSWELRNYEDVPKDVNVQISDAQQKELIHGYYACVSYIDHQIGELLDHLEAKGLMKNTVIVLWGDHGWHLGDHGIFCKHTNFEQATRAPLMIGRGNEFKGYVDSPTEFLDVFSTVCDLANVPVPKFVDGKSLVPVMSRKVSKVHDYAVSQFDRNKSLMGYTFRDNRYRYTVWMKDNFRSTKKYDKRLIDSEELYDYKTDSLETTNQINNPKYKSVRMKLTQQSVQFFKSQELKK